MDPIDTIGRLPDAYAKALLLERDGATADEIARRLVIPVEGVGSLLELAHRKLTALADSAVDPTPLP